MYLPKVPAYETFYYDLAWSDPAKAIVEIEKLLQSPANLSPEEVAGLKFLHCCLTQVRFEPRCACAHLPQPHCYYDHLFEWFCIVAERRLPQSLKIIDARKPQYKPTSLLLLSSIMPLSQKLFYITGVFSLTIGELDKILASMYITLYPYFEILINTFNKSLISDNYISYHIQLKYLRHSTSSTYIRIATSLTSSDDTRFLRAHEFDPCEYSTKCREPSICDKKFDLSRYDLRGCSFLRVRFDNYKLHYTNCSNTAWVHCSMANLDFGDNCQFHNAYIAPPHLPLLIYCHTYGQQLAHTPPAPAMINPTMQSCFLPPQQPTPNTKSLWWSKFSRLFN